MRAAVPFPLAGLARALPAAGQPWDDPARYAAPLDLSMTADPARGVTAVIGPPGGGFAAQ